MTQEQFYKSQAWRRSRKAYIDKRIAVDGGICEVCHAELGKIVHHKIWLDDNNCNDPSIALNEANYRYECQDCHNKERDPRKEKKIGRVKFTAAGELIFCGD